MHPTATDDDTLDTIETTEPQSDSYRELVDELGKLHERMACIVDTANKAREMSSENEAELKRCKEKYEKLVALRDRNVELFQLRARSADAHDAERRAIGRGGAVEHRDHVARERADTSTGLPRFRVNSDSELRCKVMQKRAYADAFYDLIRGNARGHELRAMTEGVDADGGYLPAADFYATLEKVLFQETIFRQACTVIPLGTFKTNIAIEDTIAVGGWGAEAAAIAETTPTFAQLTLQPRRLAVIAKVSYELVQDAPSRGPGFSVESIVTDQIGRAFGLHMEEGFAVGNPASFQPKGLFTYTSESTITTAVTTASASAISADNIIDWLYAVPRQYMNAPGAGIIMHHTAAAVIRKLASPGSGNFLSYLWETSFKAGEPDRIMGKPLYISPYAPAMGANNIIGVAGDLKRYWIGERTGIAIQVLRELYAGTGQIGYQAIARMDGGVTIRNAFRYLKAGA